VRFIAYEKRKTRPRSDYQVERRDQGQGQVTARACASGPEEVGEA
jgi:hypothetical protein